MSRSIDAATLSAAKATVQCPAEGNAPRLSLWISRPVTQLVDSHFLETLDLAGLGEVGDCSIAVKHTRFGRAADAIYIAYVVGGVSNADGGLARVCASPYREAMARHTFADCGFSRSASRVAIAFDGTMPKRVSNTYEFITESAPWVFWISQAALYAQRLGTDTTVTLAESNCTYVSAVRAMWSEVDGFDFGLCCFFIINGSLYYRQRIGGVWYDAEVVPLASLPTLASGVTWTEVAASRTWDYRVVLQLKASDGALYEVFTQFGGLGSKGAEHIEVRDVRAKGQLTALNYRTGAESEHISVAGVTASGALIYALSSKPLAAANADDGTGNWGVRVGVTMDYPITGASGNAAAFAMSDGSKSYACTAAESSGTALTLSFADFNAAAGKNLTLTYTPGTVQSPATAMEAWTITFTPTNLVAPQVDPPKVTEVQNV